MSIYQSTKVSPYVYQLTHKVNGQFYIGYREANLVPSDQDIGFFYWTSSKIVEPIFSEFNIQILAEFFDGDSAWNQEQRIIEANIKNPLCLNGHYVKDGKIKFSYTGKFHSIETKVKMLGRKVSDESKAKMSIAKSNPSDYTRKKMSDSQKGKTLSKETKEKISASSKYLSDESRAKISASSKGRIQSEETKLKRSNSSKGRILSEETKLKISKAHKGKIISDEQKLKLSIAVKAAKAKKLSDETKDEAHGLKFLLNATTSPASSSSLVKILKNVKS